MSDNLAEALEKTQVCPPIQDFIQQHLPHPLVTYKRIARLIAQEAQDGTLRFFYSLRGYAVEEVQRLQKVGWDIRNDDVVFREGQAAFGALVHPLDTSLTEAEKRRIEEVRVQYENQKKARMEAMKPPMKQSSSRISELP